MLMDHRFRDYRRILLAALCLLAALPASANSLPLPFSADYAAYRGSLHLADSHFSLEKVGPHTYVYQSRTEPVGLLAMLRSDVITESSRFNYTDGQFRPISYHYSHTGGTHDKTASLLFDWDTDTVKSIYKDDTTELDLKPGMLDRFVAQLALSRDIANDKLKEHYTVVDQGKIKIYQLHRGQTKSFDTPAGRFDAILVERIDGKDKTRFWCAPKLDYVPVVMEKVRDGKPNIRMELTQFSLASKSKSQAGQANAESDKPKS